MHLLLISANRQVKLKIFRKCLFSQFMVMGPEKISWAFGSGELKKGQLLCPSVIQSIPVLENANLLFWFLFNRSFIYTRCLFFFCKLLIVPLEKFHKLESFWWHIYSAVIIKREGPYWITQQGAHSNRCAQYNEYGIIKSNQTTLKRQPICLRSIYQYFAKRCLPLGPFATVF